MIEILEKGFLTLPVSSARHHLERYGVPRTGPLDVCRYTLANRLVDNPDGAWALEATMAVPAIFFHEAHSFAVVGGECGLFLEREGRRIPVPAGRAAEARAGDRLTGGPLQSGFRAYLAVAGGIEGASCVPLSAGDRLTVGQTEGGRLRTVLEEPLSMPGRNAVLRVVEGVHAGQFSPEGLAAFYGGPYAYTPQSDRMGVRFAGEPVGFAPGRDGNIISEGTLPGDIQVPASGQPLLMLEACQTVGGYAKIAHVIAADLPMAAQLVPGAQVRFRLVSVPEAQAAWRRLWYKMSCCID